jgi:hypothetical protein
VAGEGLADEADEAAVDELGGRDVDGDPEVGPEAEGLAPAREVGAGLVEHEGGQVGDPPRVLEQGHERGGGQDEVTVGVFHAPPGERLDADELAAAEADHRLVVGTDLAAGDGVEDGPQRERIGGWKHRFQDATSNPDRHELSLPAVPTACPGLGDARPMVRGIVRPEPQGSRPMGRIALISLTPRGQFWVDDGPRHERSVR